MPEQTSVWHCSLCRLLEVTQRKARAICPLCGGALLQGAPHAGTYAPMSSVEKHAVFARMMSGNGDVRGH